MPLQNRVDPSGVIFRTAARGTLMGNRGGVIHNDAQQIVRQYSSRRWIACVLEFKGRKREVMRPNRYTELFFLDEAVALAAGHRPCAECRRERFNAFREAWKHSAGRPALDPLLAPEMDAELHRTRIDIRRRKVTYRARLDSLPNGCFVSIDEASYLVWDDALLLWSPEAYVKQERRPKGLTVTVLTPEPIVRCVRHGYRPAVHQSAFAVRLGAFPGLGHRDLATKVGRKWFPIFRNIRASDTSQLPSSLDLVQNGVSPVTDPHPLSFSR